MMIAPSAHNTGPQIWRQRVRRILTAAVSARLNCPPGNEDSLALIVALLDERPILMLDEFGAKQDLEHREQFYRVWLPELRNS
jgi:ABC-type siderophore export system fused ATPase/permease subunit